MKWLRGKHRENRENGLVLLVGPLLDEHHSLVLLGVALLFGVLGLGLGVLALLVLLADLVLLAVLVLLALGLGVLVLLVLLVRLGLLVPQL